MRRIGSFFAYLILIMMLAVVIIGSVLLFAPNQAARYTPPQLQSWLPAASTPLPTLIAAAVVPTLTPIPTATPTLIPTWTPAAAVPSATIPPTNTRIPFASPTNRATLPPSTPTKTATPTRTPTFVTIPTQTPLPGPTGTPTHTRSPFLFTRTEASPMYIQNNTTCSWMGVAGEVLDLEGRPVDNNLYQIHIWGNGIDLLRPTGSSPLHGPSGWELVLADHTDSREYNIALTTKNGTTVSQVYKLFTLNDCGQNLIIFNFVQNH